MKTKQHIITAVSAVTAAVCAACVPIVRTSGALWAIALLILLCLAGVALPLAAYSGPKSMTLRLLLHGLVCLRAFCIATLAAIPLQVYVLVKYLASEPFYALGSAAVAFLVLAVVFWVGMILVYLFSLQLGIDHKLKGALLGLVPVANLVMLYRIMDTVSREVDFERDKLYFNKERASKRVCATSYPILMVHGVCFRDFAFPNYWGRVPAYLERNGARVFFGNHGSAASVADSALELAARIRYITDDLGYGKVNIIAHSKGGLDCRYAIACYGVADRVASLITVNTPHRGCAYADYLLGKIPKGVQDKVASAYNRTLSRLGDDEPDFLAAMRDLTEERVQKLNAEMDDERFYRDIYRISIGSKINERRHVGLPLSLTHGFVKRFVGENDGLVSVDSFSWGENYRFINSSTLSGISHADVIDMTCRNMLDFDVREYYVSLVSELKERGL